MNMTSSEIITAIKDYFSRNEERLHEGGLLAAYIVSSLARGDFLEGNSDADVLLIFSEGCTSEKTQKTWKKVSEELSDRFSGQKCEHPHFIDLPWEVNGNYAKSSLKCFRFFFDDLRENNIHVFGKDVITNLKLKQPSKQDYFEKIKHLLKGYRESDSVQEKTLFIGEAIKYFLSLNGIHTLNKFEILNALKIKNYPEIHEFYRKYANGDLSGSAQGDLNDEIARKIDLWLK